MGHDPVAASPETHCWTTPVRRITSLPTSRTLQAQRPAGADGELAPRSQGGGFRDPADVVTGRPVACINKATKALARLAGEVTTVTADPSTLTDITRRAGRCRCGRRSPGSSPPPARSVVWVTWPTAIVIMSRVGTTTMPGAGLATST